MSNKSTWGRSKINTAGTKQTWIRNFKSATYCLHTVSTLQVTHNASPVIPLTIDGTVLKESDDLDILGATFDSQMTFEKHLRSVSRAAFQRFSILRKSWRVFHERSLLVRCFRGFVLPLLEYWSAVWCSAVDTHPKLLDCVVIGAVFRLSLMNNDH